MTLPSIIGLAGMAGSGKTTIANALNLSGLYARRSFATPLRKMLMAIGLSEEDLREGKEIPHSLLAGKTPRWAMQTLGTEWGRECIDADIWARLATYDLTSQSRVIFDDVRFPSEIHAIRALGGFVIGLRRDSEIVFNHASSQPLPNINYVSNNGTVGETLRAINEVWRKYSHA